MSIDTQATVIDQSDADAFKEFASAFDSENGVAKTEVEPVQPENEIELVDAESATASAQQQESKPEEFDFNSLPEPAKKRLEYLEQYQKSNEGRVGALQKQLDAQRGQLEQLQQKGNGDSKAAQDLEQAIEENEVDLGALVEELPELSVLVNEVKSLREQVKKTNGVVTEKVIQPEQARAAQEAQESELAELKKAHQDLSEIESNPAFWNWVDAQHDAVRKLSESPRAEDVSALVKLYKERNESSGSNPPDKKLQRNVDDLLALPSDGNGRSSSPSGDDAALFAHYAKLADAGKL
jgi:chromosome segregation ATPase